MEKKEILKNFKKINLKEELAKVSSTEKVQNVILTELRRFIRQIFFYDLKEGIKFVPDIKMLSVGLNYVKKIEKYNDVKLNGAVAIVDGNNNSYSRLAYAANFFARNLHIRIATSYEEAYNFIKKYSKTEEIRKLSFV